MSHWVGARTTARPRPRGYTEAEGDACELSSATVGTGRASRGTTKRLPRSDPVSVLTVGNAALSLLRLRAELPAIAPPAYSTPTNAQTAPSRVNHALFSPLQQRPDPLELVRRGTLRGVGIVSAVRSGAYWSSPAVITQLTCFSNTNPRRYGCPARTTPCSAPHSGAH
jgi:hypothetical protein